MSPQNGKCRRGSGAKPKPNSPSCLTEGSSPHDGQPGPAHEISDSPIASSRPAPAIMPRPRERSTLLKSVPRAPGRDRARQGDRSRPDRGLVRGRGPGRAEEQDHPALGTTGNAALGAARSAHRFHLHLRGYLPGDGKGAALVLPACNTEAMNLHLAEIAAEVAPGKHAVLVVDQA